MKQKQLLGFIALLISAALLGWLLPSAVFLAEDHIEERKLDTLEIKQFDISYQSDLDTAARLQIIHDTPDSSAMPLERGIYLQAQDVEKIAKQFLRECTGNPSVICERFEITPILFSFSGEGTFIGWDVSMIVNESWTWDALIDDQTGLILRCSFAGAPMQWDSLFPEFGSEADSVTYIVDKLSSALCSHFQAKLSEALSSDIRWEESGDYVYIASILLSEDSIPKYTIPVVFVLEEGMISINH